ncbi:MAG TPA: hypothetical protein VK427_14285, partial [Kofleriaceae bacterium]|nr:hypothetical protein [Kofleriaceae bacterium]
MHKRGIRYAFALGTLLTATTVHAQAPVPAPERPAPEKGTTGESLQEGGEKRPWAVGVTLENQQKAVVLFREGNQAHNDGLFVRAVERYRQALKHWDHPAIHYNMALSLTNLDKPIEVEAELQASIKFGAAPLEKGKFEHAKQSLLLIEKQLATIEVSCQKEGARVSIDNKEVFVVARGKPNVYKARVKIGKHTFVAEKPGYATGLDAPFIGPGETFR